MSESEKAKEVNDVAPSSLRHIVGQHSVVAQVTVALEAAWADHRRFDHAMLTGAPGLGKTALARVVSCEMAVELHEVLGQSVRKPADLNALLLAAKDLDVIHIDEAHELNREQQTALYLALDQRKLLTRTHTGQRPQPIPLSDFTLLLSTTDEYRLLQPLRDRMRLNLRYEFYAPHNLVTLISQRVKALKWEVEEAVFPEIAARARGTPRIALSLLQAAHRVCRAEGANLITFVHLGQACGLAEIDKLGLNITERRYLRLLADQPNRLNVLASRLGLPTKTVAEVTEAYLVRAGLVEKDKDGMRALTPEGREHVLQEGRDTV